MASPRLVALDFDGVISDSAPEAFVVALRTWFSLRPESSLRGAAAPLLTGGAPPPARVAACPLYAPFLEMMPLGNRAEDYAVELAVLEAGAGIADQAAYDAYKATVDAQWLRRFHREFYRIRDALSAEEPAAWLRLMGPYAGVPELLRRRGADARLAIATSKDRRSVRRLLGAYGIAELFPEGLVLDKENGADKRAHLEYLHGALGTPYEHSLFVDDKVNHLDSVAGLGVACALAGWGYNGPREHALARERGYPVLALDRLEEALFG